MDFKQIDAFINVAKFKSFSKAANSIFLSQPAISSHIAILEKELKVQLFDRTSKEVVLTPAGESFLKFAIEILNIRDKAIHTLVNFNKTITGRLKLAASTTPCNALVPSLIKNFHHLYPDATYNIVESNCAQIIKNIMKFDCEIGFVSEPVNDEKIKSYKLVEDELVIISPPSFNIPEVIDIPSLFKYNFILREKGSTTRRIFEDILHQNGYNISNIDSYFEVNNLDTLIQFVKNGLGIAAVSNHLFRDYISWKLIKESKLKNIHLKRTIYLILSSKRTLTPTAMAFFDLCKKTSNIK